MVRYCSRIHWRVALLGFVGICLQTRAFVPQPPNPLSWTPSACRSSCRAPPLRVAMQFQSASSAGRRGREVDFQMPKSRPLPAKREPEGPLEDDPSLPMVEDIIRALDERKVRCPHISVDCNCRAVSQPS